MPSSKSSSKSTSNHPGSDHSNSKPSKHQVDKNSHRHRRHSHGEHVLTTHSDDNLELPEHTNSTSQHSQKSKSKDDHGQELYRLDEGSQIWRTYDGSVIYWEVHKLTYQELSEAIWNWAERGLEPTQKLYMASLRPPHGGHRSGLLDFFCSHRQKLVRDHIQRIYSDLYLILRTWTELKHYLQQLNEKNSPQERSQTLKKIENRLTFHLMVALREYCGLPLDPKHPDKPSWPATGDKDLPTTRLEPGALASATNSVSAPSIKSEKSSPRTHDFDTKAICCHCHQILDHTETEETLKQDTKLSIPPSGSTSKQESSRSRSQTSRSSSRKADNHSKSRKVNEHRSKSRSRKDRENKPEDKDSKGKDTPHSSHDLANKNSKSTRSRHSEEKSNDDSEYSSLISFDSTQFSNAFGMIFHHR
ncbi:hypothetical protein PGT21_033431 [Puccinia graminis f. sp. tritici]|uniref:Uncharacterized protein n=1 Tax=Puccinia graminis f. sp. tritici TaxID=56615 RepID=A0A5B0P263_PUCGR|nr:hypothetical protein PGTUg99_012987 [Puccinia graminis f. sp. tritici]KAA1094952.1 hypothetical protein PGT21_033431 [Puccinia graminis f. sp. tritici]